MQWTASPHHVSGPSSRGPVLDLGRLLLGLTVVGGVEIKHEK